MNAPIIAIGIGELGSVFARGFLKTGHPVYPITRDMDMQQLQPTLPMPEAVLVSVGEADLHPTLAQLPEVWKDKVILLQNELLPRDWMQHQLTQPTIISVWFEKKKGMDSKVVLPSPVWGPHAQLVMQALNSLDIPTYEVTDADEMTYELVHKNLYILTTNIAGLELPPGTTVAQLRDTHGSLMEAVAQDVLKIQAALVDTPLDQARLMTGMLEAFDGDPAHKCMGRSAPARLKRALEHARLFNLSVPTLEKIAAKHLP